MLTPKKFVAFRKIGSKCVNMLLHEEFSNLINVPEGYELIPVTGRFGFTQSCERIEEKNHFYQSLVIDKDTSCEKLHLFTQVGSHNEEELIAKLNAK